MDLVDWFYVFFARKVNGGVVEVYKVVCTLGINTRLLFSANQIFILSHSRLMRQSAARGC